MDVKFEWKETHHDAFMKLKEPKQNKTYMDKHGQSSHHQKRNEKNTDRQGN